MLFGLGSGNESRNILLNGEINAEMAERVIHKLMEISKEDEDALSTRIGYEPEPVVIYINSVGGNVYDGRAIIAAIESVSTPVYTVALGACMSMALAILLAGEVRYANRHARLMYHGVLSWNGGSIVEQERHITEMKCLQKEYDEYVIERTGGLVTQEELDMVRKDFVEWFMGAKEAKANGFVHALIPMDDEEYKEFIDKIKNGEIRSLME